MLILLDLPVPICEHSKAVGLIALLNTKKTTNKPTTMIMKMKLIALLMAFAIPSAFAAECTSCEKKDETNSVLLDGCKKGGCKKKDKKEEDLVLANCPEGCEKDCEKECKKDCGKKECKKGGELLAGNCKKCKKGGEKKEEEAVLAGNCKKCKKGGEKKEEDAVLAGCKKCKKDGDKKEESEVA